MTPEELAIQQAQDSEYGQALAAAGVRPTKVTDDDIQAMVAQMSKMQAQLDQMNAERGVPLDRVDGYRQQLGLHFSHRKSARPDTDFTSVENLLTALPQNPDAITVGHTEALHFSIEQLLKANPGKELEYLGVLAAELHQEVLSREGKSGVVNDRVSALEQQVADLMSQLESLKAVKANG